MADQSPRTEVAENPDGGSAPVNFTSVTMKVRGRRAVAPLLLGRPRAAPPRRLESASALQLVAPRNEPRRRTFVRPRRDRAFATSGRCTRGRRGGESHRVSFFLFRGCFVTACLLLVSAVGLHRATASSITTQGASPGMSIMLDAKNARKRAEADVQLLANRLQHLRVAEERARKKICETKVGRSVGRSAPQRPRRVSSRRASGRGRGRRRGRENGVTSVSQQYQLGPRARTLSHPAPANIMPFSRRTVTRRCSRGSAPRHRFDLCSSARGRLGDGRCVGSRVRLCSRGLVRS